MASTTDSDDRFAIIGVGCRMPPAGTSLAAFWRFLMKGGNALKPIKSDRWDWRKYFDEDQNRPGKTYAPKGAFLDWDFRLFDPGVFGISPREASFLDPQQRLLLEVVWEALEDAGLPVGKVSGSATGVFIGAFCIDHLVQQVQPSNRHLLSAHSTVGASMTIISNRISHAFNLRGPSLTLDTACSSSLVAVHYACQALRLGEAEMVIAGGVNVMTRPEYPIMMSKGHFLSHHGECHAFDESAAGYARGEGAGVILIKTLRKALEDGDPIHAVIRGSGANQDGHTDGISLPNSEAQLELLDSVYAKCGVAAADVDYVEAHGTGTQAGDPAEAYALHTHFAKGRAAGKKLLIGSVKTNVGHLEAAAGMAGIFKSIGILRERKVPKNLHFEKPNPKIPFADYCLKVVAEPTALPTAAEKAALLIGVNSFGYGGTNAHVVLESAPVRTAPAAVAKTGWSLIPLSASSEKALRDLAGKMAFQVGPGFQGTLGDVAYTTAYRRSHLEFRSAAAVENIDRLREVLISASTGQPQPELVAGVADRDTAQGIVFVYTGMGPQWWAMGQELIRTVPLVAETVDEIDAHFVKLAGWSLREAMLADEKSSQMERTEVAQTANFALQIALTRLWASYGIKPTAVVGHSVGEVASSYVAGVYSLEDAVKISYHRSRLQQTTAGQGAMLAVGLPEKDVARLLVGKPGVSVAAVNSFNAVTLSGDKAGLDAIAAMLEGEGTFFRFLRVEVAYHSPQMDPLHEELLAVLADLEPREATLPLYSTAYGVEVPAASWDAEYWWVNVRQSVRFADAMKELLDAGYATFLEVGPHPVLSTSIKECAGTLEKRVRCFTSLKRKESEQKTLLLALGELYCAGFAVDWSALAPVEASFLPAASYPWQRAIHWTESERTRLERVGSEGPVYLDTPSQGPSVSWEVEINRNYFPFLFDHGVQNQTVFAGMGYVEAALALSQRIYDKPAIVLENIGFEKILIVDYAKLQFLITEYDEEAGRFTISSRVEGEEGGVLRHCRGRIRPQVDPRPGTLDLAKLRAECPTLVGQDAFYDRLAVRGLRYGPAFRPTTEILVGEDCFLVRLDGSAVAGERFHPLHPTIFDAAVQPVLYCAKGERLFVPFSFDRFEYFAPPGDECYAYGRINRQTETVIVADIWLLDGSGGILAYAEGASCQLIETDFDEPVEELYYEGSWVEAPLMEAGAVEGASVVILADEDSVLARELVAKLPGAKLGTDLDERSRVLVLWGSEAGEDVSVLNLRVVGLLQAIVERSEECDVTFVTRGARSVNGEGMPNLAAFPIGAIALTAQNENDALTCRSVDLDSAEGGADLVLAEVARGGSGDVAYRGGVRWENSLNTYAPEAGEQSVRRSVEDPVELRMGRGKIDGLHYVNVPRVAPEKGEIELRIESVGLNYKDLLKVEGRIQPIVLEDTFNETAFGMECVGVVLRTGPESRFQPRDRVVAMLKDGFRTYGIAPEVFAVKLPATLGVEAAGIPVVYLAAYRGLVDIARLEKGERVLIHHATGGVGMAAVAIARWAGADVFATAGSEEKRELLRGLGITQVYSSRDLDFGQRIREATQGEGVDVVIGAQTGQAMHVSLGLLRSGGRYIEVGKKDIAEDNGLPLRAFNQNLIFASVDIDRLMKREPALIGRTLETILARFEDGSFTLSPSKSVAAGEIQEAFREMARSQHIGKLLIDFSQGEVDVLETAASGGLIRADGCYIVTGGTSGFGLATGLWLAEKGAGRVILVSRSGRKAAGLEEISAQIEAAGAKLDILAVDVTDAEQIAALVAEAKDGGFALRGVLHGAMVLDDAMLADVTEESFRRVFQPKVAGALHLAEAVKGEALDFFVFFSSISAVVGNRGQTSYVAANALLDGLAQKLRAGGVPALSINWGALAETGVVARSENVELILSSSGITGLTNAEAFAALEVALASGRPQLAVAKVDWEKWHEAHPRLAEDARFRELRLKSHAGDGGGVAEEIRKSLVDQSREQRLRALEEHLRTALAATLRMPAETVPLNRKINEMGVDSLMVLELSLGIKERIGVGLSAMEFLKGPTVQQLAEMSETRLWSK